MRWVRCGHTPESGRGVLVQSFGRYLRYMRLGSPGGVRPRTRYIYAWPALYGILPCILRESNCGVGLSGPCPCVRAARCLGLVACQPAHPSFGSSDERLASNPNPMIHGFPFHIFPSCLPSAALRCVAWGEEGGRGWGEGATGWVTSSGVSQEDLAGAGGPDLNLCSPLTSLSPLTSHLSSRPSGQTWDETNNSPPPLSTTGRLSCLRPS